MTLSLQVRCVGIQEARNSMPTESHPVPYTSCSVGEASVSLTWGYHRAPRWPMDNPTEKRKATEGRNSP